MSIRVLILLCAWCGAAAADPTVVTLKGSSFPVSFYFPQPSSCSVTTALACGSIQDCPPGEDCVPGAPSPIVHITYRVDVAKIPHACKAGANKGMHCLEAADCPASSCNGVLLGTTTLVPSPAAAAIKIILGPAAQAVLTPIDPQAVETHTVSAVAIGANGETEVGVYDYGVTNAEFLP